MSVAEKNKKKLDKFITENSVEIHKWLDDFVNLYNDCGNKTKEGSVQLAFAGACVLGMFKSMKHAPKKEKVRVLKEIEKDVKKQ